MAGVATTGGSVQAEQIERFTITVTLDGIDADTMMRLVSVFHRRQIEVIQSTYQRVASTGWMVAIVETTQARLNTTAATLGNTIGVTGYEVAPMSTARPALVASAV
ncbi:hypothetical protein [Microbacterium sp.]|uniref:hypothetical protein n=1 Tax=Microbacterium sp. TaxID=51671 RepID=UPI002639A91E|nr:hypothetical protein [Microbacterium sp.]